MSFNASDTANVDTATKTSGSERAGLGHDIYGEAKPKLRGLVHAWAAVPIGIAALVLLVMTPDLGTRIAVAIYAVSITGMLSASACYHRLRVSERARNYLRRLDHSMIGVAVAGTYTPVIVLSTSGAMRTSLLTILWIGALGAMAVSVFFPGAPSWARALVYVLLGWAGAVAMPSIWNNGGVPAFVMVIIGAILYTVGAIAYATHKPNPWPRVFGFHEVFHALVVLAVVAHFAAVSLVVFNTA